MRPRWGFVEGDEWDEEDESAHVDDSSDDDELLHGQDSHGIVTVTVTDQAKVVLVHLEPAWRSSIAPRALDSSVLEAANAATMHALAKQVEQTDMSGEETVQDVHAQAPASWLKETSQNDSPITKQDAMRLLDAVSTDLGNYLDEVTRVISREFTVESGGGHVNVTSKQGQISAVSVDLAWASQVRHT
ncbi:hypothetical protein [Haloechinothrix sp. LS1_15]|uniref:hypothetical protein n=1 Tax=Haloechinothrix sp. LS1_15 TaxID=2652248 RepID=UPI002946A605|nr:hypothetical protein [Haloechinothrix sp. LS1_15]MDV6011141.1 hypothetical protein [Haloechinothrix sp. LS1_15]